MPCVCVCVCVCVYVCVWARVVLSLTRRNVSEGLKAFERAGLNWAEVMTRLENNGGMGSEGEEWGVRGRNGEGRVRGRNGGMGSDGRNGKNGS